MPKIVIEGVDGSGKTAISELLQKKTNGVLIASSQISFLPSIRKYTNLDIENTFARFVYYLSLNKYTTDTMAKDPSKTYIFDRYIYSTISTHLVLDKLYNKGKNIENLIEIFNEESKNFVTPEILVFLYVNQKARTDRLKLRGKKEDGILDFNSSFAIETQNLLREMARGMRKFGTAKIIEIDTSEKTTKVSTEIILKASLRLNS